MSFVKVMIHCVWSTKNREPVLTKEPRTALINHIIQAAHEKKVFIDCINGHTDHLHALISLGQKQTVADIIQQLKGESSFWANQKSKLFTKRFEWADKYFAVSVSESQLDKVRNYIEKQEEHHRTITFQEEYETFVKRYGFVELG